MFNNAGAGLTPVINVPGGGASRSTRRPDLVPGVDPFIKDGGLIFLNPAAFATPKPGTFGNLERNSIHGPWFRQVDLVVSKRIALGQGKNLELRSEFFNLFNHPNFGLPDNEVDVEGGASITNTASNNREVELALKYTF